MDLKFILNVDAIESDQQSFVKAPNQKDSDKQSFANALNLILGPSQSSNDNNDDDNNNNDLNVVVQIPNPPSITPEDLFPNNAPISARDIIPRHFSGFTAYRCEYVKQAALQGLNLPFNKTSATARRLWKNENPTVVQLYNNIGHQAELNYLRRNVQFPPIPYKCEGCEKCE